MPNALESVFMAETEVKTNGRPEAKFFVFSLPNWQGPFENSWYSTILKYSGNQPHYPPWT